MHEAVTGGTEVVPLGLGKGTCVGDADAVAAAEGECAAGEWEAVLLLPPQPISITAARRTTMGDRMRAAILPLESPVGMIGGLKVGVVIPAFNEAGSIERLLPRIPGDLVDEVIVVNDCSTDESSASARSAGATVIDRKQRGGPGPAIRDGLDLLRSKGYGLVAVMASNGKHDPAQLPDLIRPLVDEKLDLVRGSRHLSGGGHVNMPWHRLFLIQVFTVLFSILVGKRVTDATGGYQAYRLKILEDKRIDLHQEWLGRYEVETYLFAKTLMCGYRWKEVPVQITYAGGKKPYTRARPVVDWWGYFRPVLLLRLGLKR